MGLRKLVLKGLKDSTYYLFGDTGVKLIRVFALPVITSLLTVEEFGQYDLLLLSSAIIEITIGFGLDSGFAVLVADKNNKSRDLRSMFTLSMCFVALLGTVVGGIAILLNNTFDWFSQNTLLLVVFYTVFISLSRLIFNFLRWNEEAKKAAMANFVGSVSGTLAGLALIFWLDSTVFLLITGLLLGSVLALAINLVLVRNILVTRFEPGALKAFKAYLLHSFPFVPSYLMNYFLKSSDRWLIVSFIGLQALGEYAVISRISQLVLFGVNLFGKGFLPIMFKNYTSPDGRRLIKKVYDYFNLLIIPFICLAFFFSPLILQLFAEDYEHLSLQLTVMIGANLVIGGMSLSGFGFTIMKRTIWIPMITGASILINVIISYFLIVDFGINGVIVGTLIAAVVTALIRTWISENMYKFGYSFRLMAMIFTLLTGASLYLILINPV
ncbi:oligosaccharide flippase family protein [Roseivirga sp. E12]|uniref:oligosaccharide flippase family protein n=1 Tax=Roseivirga sp. E12 TaxID=2819237 RepID=UPI001ABC9566|nr:oligosaccharide flippase family protein [Roseivirga sp. E12]MBO3699751.1 oligosaccharide flippase family protein [Roseivirga sp. E12]